MLSRIPEKRRRPARVTRNRYDLEIVPEGMPPGERSIYIVDPGDLFLLVLVGIQRRVESTRDPRTGRLRPPCFVTMVQVLSARCRPSSVRNQPPA